MAKRGRKPGQAPMSGADEAGQANRDVEVGLRLRHQRLAKRMTLREVADKAECSESMLSKVENGRALPSLTALHKLCGVLGLTVGQLFKKANAPPGVLLRANERPALNMNPLRPNTKVRIEQLVPVDPGNLLEGSIHVIPPNSGLDLVVHEGEEVCYVIEGTVEAMVGGEIYTVETGDSLHFRSERPHGYRNSSLQTARMIIINTPPTF